VLDHRFCPTLVEAIQCAVDESADPLSSHLFTVGDVMPESCVLKLGDGFVDEVLFPGPKKLTEFQSDDLPDDAEGPWGEGLGSPAKRVS